MLNAGRRLSTLQLLSLSKVTAYMLSLFLHLGSLSAPSLSSLGVLGFSNLHIHLENNSILSTMFKQFVHSYINAT